MNLSKVNIEYLKKATEHILQTVVSINYENGGYIAFQLFKECEVTKDEKDQWIVRIDAHDKALPLMFELKGHFFKYKLWNTLRLKSRNQLRMYELLKQYEKIGHRTLAIKDLKLMLGIKEDDYIVYADFRRYVLEVCKEALTEYTDITFTYEPHGKKGPRGKILQLKFNIFKNENYKDPLSLSEFIDLNKAEEENIILDPWDMDEDQLHNYEKEHGEIDRREKRLIFFRDAVDGEFNRFEMEMLCDILAYKVPINFHDDLECYNYLKRKYNELKLRDRKGEVNNRFAYFKKILEFD